MEEELSENVANRPHLNVVIKKALTYYKLQQFDSFVLVLETGIKRCKDIYEGYFDDLMCCYNLLAAHYVQQAYKFQAVTKRRCALLAKATNLFHAMDTLGLRNNCFFVCRGFACLLSTIKMQDANKYFTDVLKKDPNNWPSLVGCACVAYIQKEYRNAIGFLKRVLFSCTLSREDVRVGIAHCFLRLLDVPQAKSAFKLALESNKDCINAMLGIATIELGQQDPHSLQEGINMLFAAFRANNQHPLTLNWLANHFHYMGSFDKERMFALRAYNNSLKREVLAQSCYRIARSFHAEKNFEQAFKFYDQAVKLGFANYPLPLVGLGQMLIHRQEYEKAEGCFLKHLKIFPNDLQVMRILGTLYRDSTERPKMQQCIQMLCRVVETYPNDYTTWVSLAICYERKAMWDAAQCSYRRAVRFYKSTPEGADGAPVQWLNNMAAAQVLSKEYMEAQQTLVKTLGQLDKIKQRDSDIVTMKFNFGRTYEELKNYEIAERIYKEIIHDYPNYIDCYLRLGIMAQNKNQIVSATDYFKDALRVNSTYLPARTFLGNLYLRQGNFSLSLRNYDVIRHEQKSLECPYTLIAIANVYLQKMQLNTAPRYHSAYKRNQVKAIKYYKKAYEINSRNICAANGIAAALCSFGRVADGAIIFKQILESNKTCYEIFLNMGHAALDHGQFIQASQIYKHCLKNFSPAKSVEIMRYLARSLFQSNCIFESKILLLKARHLAPYDHSLIFNLALNINEESKWITANDRGDLNQLERIVQELNAAQRFFKFLVELKEVHSTLAHSSAYLAEKCSQILDNVVVKIDGMRNLEKLDVSRLEMQREKYRKIQLEILEEKKKKAEKDLILAEQQNVMRNQMLERAKNIMKSAVVEGKKQRKKSRSQKKCKKTINE